MPDIRDAIEDPQPGDRLTGGKQWPDKQAEVTEREWDSVTFMLGGCEVTCDLDDWQEWMEGAEVVNG
jgi:hypothetical protein